MKKFNKLDSTKKKKLVPVYMTLAILVLGGMAMLWFMDDGNSSDHFLSGAIVSDELETATSQEIDPELETSSKTGLGISSGGSSDENSGSTSGSGSSSVTDGNTLNDAKYFDKEVDVEVNLNKAPSFEDFLESEQIDIIFEGYGEKIEINGDWVELSASGDAELRLIDFTGKIGVDNFDISLSGNADKVYLNGISLYSSNDGATEIVLNTVSYSTLSLLNIEFEEIILPSGSGEVKVANKMTYTLEDESSALYYFIGDFSLSKDSGTELIMEGNVQGLSVSGDYLGLDLS
ncbi:hypothetical protein HN652_04205 [archaeon]|nr:hypothetical protein [archaeon]MBT6869004.1 hypothetical protein [archaeon]MBT7193270.1 hypothetical protein [archaeon]MBT7380125.1 hypothetical protein [archaeon]MBT7508192.1 hypothetical protein [archaeon]